jgi:hypothetical protein
MITSLYPKYFQKSKSFIYPLVNIPKNAQFSPTLTYLSWEGVYTLNDTRLIAKYETDVKSLKWLHFLRATLFNNPFFDNYSFNDEGTIAIVVFNMTLRKDSYKHVIQGKYSQINPDMRSLILMYYGYNTPEWAYMQTFLTPLKFTSLYAKLLDCHEEKLIEIGELCDIPNFTKEHLVIFTDKVLASQINTIINNL